MTKILTSFLISNVLIVPLQAALVPFIFFGTLVEKYHDPMLRELWNLKTYGTFSCHAPKHVFAQIRERRATEPSYRTPLMRALINYEWHLPLDIEAINCLSILTTGSEAFSDKEEAQRRAKRKREKLWLDVVDEIEHAQQNGTLNQKSRLGETALHCAAHYCPHAIPLLLEAGATPDKTVLQLVNSATHEMHQKEFAPFVEVARQALACAGIRED